MKEFKKDLVIGTDVVGHPIYITKHVIDSEKPGKVVYVQGGIHGGEITLHMIRDIYDYLKFLEDSDREKDKLRIPLVKEYIKDRN